MEDFDWTKTRYSNGDIAPTKLNGELSREGMEAILDSVLGVENCEHLDVEHGDQRTTTHTYKVEVDGQPQKFEHNQCGLESFGNNIQYSEDAPEWFKWEVSLGVFEYISERRKRELEEKAIREGKEEKALHSLIQEVKGIDEGDFRGLELAVDTWRSAQQAITRNYV